MDFRDFIPTAHRLASDASEAEWRSAISRAYYAAFHVARTLFIDLGFRIPRSERAHTYLYRRLNNAGHADAIRAGVLLNNLRGERNGADYDPAIAVTPAEAISSVASAEEAIRLLDGLINEPTRTEITEAMKDYERDVLQDITWAP